MPTAEMLLDADIPVAASAAIHDLGVVTNNEAHFRRVRDLAVANWLRP